MADFYVPGSSSGVPYYLAANVDNVPTSTDIFNFSVSTTLPQNVNWNPPTSSVWEEVSQSLSDVYTNTKESVSSAVGGSVNFVSENASGFFDKVQEPFWNVLKGMGIMIFLTIAGIATAIYFALKG